MTPQIIRTRSRFGRGAGSRRFLQTAVGLALGVALAIATAALWSAFPARGDAPATPQASAPDSTTVSPRVVVYYFYTNYRCASCRKLEALAQEAVYTGFPKELQSGRVVWRTANVEEKGNEHFVEDYQLFTKSVILVTEKEGQQTAWKNLPRIWELLKDKQQYLRYIQAETRAFLAAAQP